MLIGRGQTKNANTPSEYVYFDNTYWAPSGAGFQWDSGNGYWLLDTFRALQILGVAGSWYSGFRPSSVDISVDITSTGIYQLAMRGSGLEAIGLIGGLTSGIQTISMPLTFGANDISRLELLQSGSTMSGTPKITNIVFYD